ncbi:scoloptoxin SSD14 isoform X3 [Dermacentor silvarum]|uniref:scoloptoxin SSD14 isoform X3 n=1 Tax=Dermacentor silvarum TaxID=543639 RepID=UPI00189B571D|nr:scoloptoxin SSD14 isoform X3 [Dermacentor silvarum]
MSLPWFRDDETTAYERLSQEEDKPSTPTPNTALAARPILLCCVFLVVVAVVSATSVLVTLYAKDSLRIKCLPGPVHVEITPSSSALGNFSTWAVSTDAAPCTSVARRIFRKGGKTVDAAIATLLCMGVVIPHSMGIGGGFIATVYSRSKREAQVLVAREVAPAGATSDMYVNNKKGSLYGGLAVAVPGELRGYQALHRHLNGTLPWKELFRDAIRLARHGFPMGAHLANALREKRTVDPVLEANVRKAFSDPETGDLLAEGELVTLKDLANTLEQIAEKGPDYFYEGELAENIVKEVQANGGILTMEDLRRYQVSWEKPVTARFKGGMTMLSAPPPASGAVLAYILGIMDAFRSSPKSLLEDSVTTLHRFAEACKFAYAKRALLGDPKFVQCEQLVRNMSSHQFSSEARYKIDDDRTFSDPHYYGFVDEVMKPDKGTAHATFWGPDGDVIVVSSTVNYYFGSMLRTSGGVVMNNQMDDFSTPGMRNFYGVAPSVANFIYPGKRPMSSMAPVVVTDENGDVQLALGGTGGAKITSGIALVIMRTLWQRNSIKEAIDYPRLHHQLIPNHLMVESYFPKAYVEELQKLGHKVTYPKGRFSIMMGVSKHNGRLYANSDFRKGGTVDGY